MKLSNGAYKAKLADMIGSYNDVIKVLTESSNFNDSSLILLLAGSLRNRVTSIRNSLKEIKNRELKYEEEKKMCHELQKVVSDIKNELEELILLESEDVERTIDDNLLIYTKNGVRAFCIKLKGDLMRYRAEILKDEEKKKCIKKSIEFYEDALENERKCLDNYPTDPLYLATVLNYAILKYDLLENPEGAMKFVNRTIQVAEYSKEEPLCEKSMKLIKILKENVALWEKGSKGVLTSAFF
ncbi:hypothetical protein FG386_002978 [Cryptosporidium ryanae]|uniref:uncharacterized protein n=1 Tax=Cryptosporidium ryanae TaxID=515981 RepID=UPI00351A37BF|nr:hypothetical protein FG386_002978 [Cryptosporidium ryanae]